MGYHLITCTCGARVATTNSLEIADRKAEYHLAATAGHDSDGGLAADQKEES